MALVGEAALSGLLEALFGKISSSGSGLQFVSEKQVRKEIMRWESTLRTIHAVLADAEEKRMKNEAVKIWLSHLQHLAYDVDDILDQFATQALGRNRLIKEHQATTTRTSNFYNNLLPSSIMFNRKMMSKIKEISGRLKGLSKQRRDLQLREINDVGRPIVAARRPPSTCLVNEGTVYGRGEDKKAILDLLLKVDDGDGVCVIPIIGMGGIGKTTLAQLVYNDDTIDHHFDLKAWVCVSEEFDILRATKTIFQSVTSESCDATNDLNLLQVRLKEKLSNKKFFIVLDDVWNEKYNDWMALRSPFDAGAPGSKIIVTTRSFNVSSIMRTVAGYSLQSLSHNDSLFILAHHALGTGDFTKHPGLKEIGLEIVKKCGGLPLATKTIGGLLRTKVNRDAWKGILESEIWNLPAERSDIIPALLLSYYYLPWQMKQCFTYCSILPKDYEFKEEELVRLWMAEGFLMNGASSTREIEELGGKYFEELVSRSFFQASSKNRSHFVMHDLINDLARFVGGEIYFKREKDEDMKLPSHTRHSSYIMGRFDVIKKFEALVEAKCLRTFLPFDLMQHSTCYLSKNVLTDLLPRLKCLRVLSLKRYYITEIPSFIGNLRHLRYLDFSYTEIKGLPDSICTLYNLMTLLLRHCQRIEKLPSKMELLEDLCHLDIVGAYKIKEMPSGIGKLTNLRTLPKFIVGQGNGLHITEMRNLSNLKGELSIFELQNVSEAQFAKEAKLSSKLGLDQLELVWSRNFNENIRKKKVEKEVLSLLQPHEELRVLAIKYYAGTIFPVWIEDPSFGNLQSLRFEGCQNCKLLPAVGKLPLLKDLYIRGMSSVISVGDEFYGEKHWPNVFPSLETLHFEDMLEWKEWKPYGNGEQGKIFQCLKQLCIRNCPKLIGTLPNGLDSLKKLVVFGCGELVLSISNLPMLSQLGIGCKEVVLGSSPNGLNSLEKLMVGECGKVKLHISNLPMLCELDINECKEVVLGSYDELWLVKKVCLCNLVKFTCLAMEMAILEMKMKAEDLLIFDGCEGLVSLWQTKRGWLAPSLRNVMIRYLPQEVVSIGQLGMPSNIECLRIDDCQGLNKLSRTVHNLTRLRVLEILRCPKLVPLSTDCLPPTLVRLEIFECGNLQCIFDDGGELIDWRNMSLLESLQIRSCKALKSISSSGWLPKSLKLLRISSCLELESVAVEIEDNTCLESIIIHKCKTIRHLPQKLSKLSCLQEIHIMDCPNLVCFPEGGLPTTSNLRYVAVQNCANLEALPDNLYSLQLQHLWILKCPKLKYSISKEEAEEYEGCLPTKLTSLWMEEPNISKEVLEWGLHRFTSLTNLRIDGGNCTDAALFPGLTLNVDTKIPHCLTNLTIQNFKNLRELSSNGFENLTSLRCLEIDNCPKLKSLPKMEMLPSLLKLCISCCPELKKRCKRDKGSQWSNIAHIPCVRIDGKFIYE